VVNIFIHFAASFVLLQDLYAASRHLYLLPVDSV